MHIIADLYGGDDPQEIIKGAALALNEDAALKITVTGDEEKVRELIIAVGKTKAGKTAAKHLADGRLIILHAPEVITNDDAPVAAIKTKKESSLVKAIDLLLEGGDYAGMFSSGNTGAVLAGGVLKIRRIEGVMRPTMCGIMPTANEGQGVAIADVGANVDCQPAYLGQFARMASIYMQVVYGVERPRVALLSVGTEEKKGDERTLAAHEILKNDPEINFLGNMEARDVLSGNYDIIVSDGFGGNVLLKTVEGMGRFFSRELKGVFKHSPLARLGMLLQIRPLKKLKRKMDYQQFGGAPFLGLKKILIKAHGSCNSTAVLVIIRQIKKMHAAGMVARIEAAVAEQMTNDN